MLAVRLVTHCKNLVSVRFWLNPFCVKMMRFNFRLKLFQVLSETQNVAEVHSLSETSFYIFDSSS